MILTTVEYRGQNSFEVFFHNPSYVQFILRNYPGAAVCHAFDKIVEQVDKLPYLVKCYDCDLQSTLAACDLVVPEMHFHCNSCGMEAFRTSIYGRKLFVNYKDVTGVIDSNFVQYEAILRSYHNRIISAKGIDVIQSIASFGVIVGGEVSEFCNL